MKLDNNQNNYSFSSLEKFKNELRKNIEENEIGSYFEKIEECNYEYDKGQFSRLRNEFIFGQTGFEFSDRLMSFINIFKEREIEDFSLHTYSLESSDTIGISIYNWLENLGLDVIPNNKYSDNSFDFTLKDSNDRQGVIVKIFESKLDIQKFVRLELKNLLSKLYSIFGQSRYNGFKIIYVGIDQRFAKEIIQICLLSYEENVFRNEFVETRIGFINSKHEFEEIIYG